MISSVFYMIPNAEKDVFQFFIDDFVVANGVQLAAVFQPPVAPGEPRMIPERKIGVAFEMQCAARRFERNRMSRVGCPESNRTALGFRIRFIRRQGFSEFRFSLPSHPVFRSGTGEKSVAAGVNEIIRINRIVDFPVESAGTDGPDPIPIHLRMQSFSVHQQGDIVFLFHGFPQHLTPAGPVTVFKMPGI